MATYKLVSFETCPWVQRAAIVLREKNVPFELVHIPRDDRPAWFLAVSPHKKVPVLRIDDRISLFESNAIVEYLDETIAPKLAPEDPVARAVNRAWTDYLPSFVGGVTGAGYAVTEADYQKAIGLIPDAFAKLEGALATQGAGPFFNGAGYSLVDAGYAPFLQRYAFLDRIRPIGHLARFPRLAAWSAALLARPSTHSFPPDRFEAMYRDNIKRRGVWLSQHVDAAPAIAAE